MFHRSTCRCYRGGIVLESDDVLPYTEWLFTDGVTQSRPVRKLNVATFSELKNFFQFKRCFVLFAFAQYLDFDFFVFPALQQEIYVVQFE